MRIALIILLCFVWLSGHAQPGPHGGTLSFKVYDQKGKIITKDNSDFRFRAGFTRQVDLYTNYNFKHEFIWVGDKLQYEAYQTPAGGVIPTNFSIIISNKEGTMRITGLPEFANQQLVIDSIPFLPGDYDVPPEYVSLINMRVNDKTVVNPLSWSVFLTSNKDQLPEITLERISNDTIEMFPEHVSGGPETKYKWELNNPYPHILKRKEGSKEWNPLFSKLNVHGSNIIEQQEREIIALKPWSKNPLCFHSLDEGQSWQILSINENIVVENFKGFTSHSFELKDVRFEGDKVIAAGVRKFRYWTTDVSLPGTFILHFNLDKNSKEYISIMERRQEEIVDWIDAHHQTYRANHIRSTKKHYSKTYPDRSTTNLLSGSFLETPGKKNLPILILKDGKYKFNGLAVRHLINRKFPAYMTNGEYSFNDSTITFNPYNPRSEMKDGTGANVNFEPIGTYYWWSSNVHLFLFKFGESKYSYKMYRITLFVKE